LVVAQVNCEQLETERNVLRQRWNTECGEKMGVKTKLKVGQLLGNQIPMVPHLFFFSDSGYGPPWQRQNAAIEGKNVEIMSLE